MKDKMVKVNVSNFWTKRNTGITLIALVITIIVLLILAGVSINIVLGENGVLTKSQEAVQNTKIAEIDEQAGFISSTALTDQYQGKSFKDSVNEAVKSYTNFSVEDIDETNGIAIIVEEETGRRYKINSMYEVEYLNTVEEDIKMNGSWSEEKQVNTPFLNKGMIAVYWDSNNNKIEYGDSNFEWDNWYDYENNKWANAVTKDSDGNITGYWVWIPRYAYKIINYHSSTAGTIDIKFLKGTSNTAPDGTTIETSGYVAGIKDTSTNYFLHPAFSSNVDLGGWDSEISGIWVAKFEASHSDATLSMEGSSSTVVIKPNVVSWRNIIAGDTYTACLNMLSSCNSHLMKNSEWGAVAYLSVSKYGRNGTEVTINSDTTYLTGGGNYTSNKAQSTTGNIYGIYDINGGAWERTASYVANTNSNLSTYGSSFASTDSTPSSTRYVTVYQMGTSDTQELCYKANLNMYGDAIYETSSSYGGSTSWFSDYSLYPYASYSFFLRGGYYGHGSNSGAFAFHGGNGYADIAGSFRPVLCIK